MNIGHRGNLCVKNNRTRPSHNLFLLKWTAWKKRNIRIANKQQLAFLFEPVDACECQEDISMSRERASYARFFTQTPSRQDILSLKRSTCIKEKTTGGRSGKCFRVSQRTQPNRSKVRLGKIYVDKGTDSLSKIENNGSIFIAPITG